MLGFARNIVSFSGKRRFRCGEKLVRARDGLRRRHFGIDSCSFCARSGTDGSRWLLLFFDDAALLCFSMFFMCWNTLCIGSAALKRWVHFLNSWNLKEASHESFVFNSSTFGIRRKSRTKASFSHLQLLEFQGSLARKLRFQLFNFWNSNPCLNVGFTGKSPVGLVNCWLYVAWRW